MSEASTAHDTARTEAFSDGILAIVITLLVLELHVPQQRDGLRSGLLNQWPTYVSYFGTFVFVGVIWVNHHQLFGRIRVVDTGLLWWNLGLLLTTSVLPFPTAVLGHAFQAGSRADQRAAIVLYGAIAALTTIGWFAVFHHLARHEHLLHDHVPTGSYRVQRRRALTGTVSYTLGTVIGVFIPQVALAVFVALPIFYGATSDPRDFPITAETQ